MNKRARNTLTGFVIVVIIAIAGYFLYTRTNTFGSNHVIKDSGSNISDFSAVFLTNGQVYFGKIYALGTTVDLRDIYYLQVNSSNSTLQNGNSSSNNNQQVSLVKLGNELHGPNDRMLINGQQVLFTESLKNDSKVVTAINNYVAGK